MARWIKGVSTISATVAAFLVFGVFWNSIAAKDEDYKNLVVFNEVLRKVQDSYVEKPDMRKLTVGALRGLAYGVDVFSCFLSAEEKKYIDARKDYVAGTGIVLAPRSGFYRVMAVRPGSSADKAGILPGDLLEEIEGHGTSELPYPYVQAMLAGPAGSEVKVAVQRGQDEESREITLKRETLSAPAVEFRILESGIGLVRVRDITEKSPEDVRRAINSLTGGGVDRVVLDLRDCCTGHYPAAAEIANLFVGTGNLAIRLQHNDERVPIPAKPDKVLFKGALAVLINGFTCGPAELVAAAIKDNKRGILLGSKTYGTAAEQKHFPLADGSSLYLTFVRYLAPNGQSITDEKYTQAGIRPEIKSPPEDYAISLFIDYEMATGEESAPLYRKYIDSVYQKQLEQAIDVLKNPEKNLQANVVEN